MSPLLKRNKKTTIAELEDYYDKKRQNRSFLNIVFAVISLAITVLVLFLLFLAARWVVNAVLNSDDESPDTVVVVEAGNSDIALPTYDTTQGDQGLPFEESASDSENDLVYSEDYDWMEGELSGVEDGEESSGVVDEEAAVIDRGDVAGAVVIATGPEIPNTGAGAALFIVPAIAGITGYIYSRNRQINKD